MDKSKNPLEHDALAEIQHILKKATKDIGNFSKKSVASQPASACQPLDTILELLTRDYSDIRIRTKKSSMAEMKAAPLDIGQLISSLSSSSKSTGIASATLHPEPYLEDLPNIEQLLLQQKDPDFKLTSHKVSRAKEKCSKSINHLLRQHAANDSVNSGKPSVSIANPTENVGALYAQASGSEVSTAATYLSSDWLKKLGLRATVAAAIIIFAVFVFQYLAAPKLRQVESPIAQFALDMAFALERYRDENGLLPAQLSQLPEFPANAIEWDIDQYSIELAESKQEFFYIQLQNSFIVISRRGDEAWSYTADEELLKQVPAH